MGGTSMYASQSSGTASCGTSTPFSLSAGTNHMHLAHGLPPGFAGALSTCTKNPFWLPSFHCFLPLTFFHGSGNCTWLLCTTTALACALMSAAYCFRKPWHCSMCSAPSKAPVIFTCPAVSFPSLSRLPPRKCTTGGSDSLPSDATHALMAPFSTRLAKASTRSALAGIAAPNAIVSFSAAYSSSLRTKPDPSSPGAAPRAFAALRADLVPNLIFCAISAFLGLSSFASRYASTASSKRSMASKAQPFLNQPFSHVGRSLIATSASARACFTLFRPRKAAARLLYSTAFSPSSFIALV
mmetsp:Transcript_23069/g.78593  ORF Transcript_23069/g.78593 Transcript_23069/m.78593 type:complete len:298 (+) Transcript_23069:713-1606(+)